MANPELVEVTRGTTVESRHRGAVAVVDTQGSSVFSIGDIERPVFPRSAIKLVQALPLIESGAADRFALSDAQLALACASHNGEPDHVAMAASMLDRIGLDVDALECGPHLPLHQNSAHALIRAGKAPTALHNNCSGKHAGFLCVANAMNVNHRHYVDPTHPAQRAVKAAIEDVAGVSLDAFGIDGCSIPTYAIPLRRLAYAFARVGTGHGLARDRAAACTRLLNACFSEPWYFGGSGRFGTMVLERFRGRVFVKIGAEGVFSASLPELGLGIAGKCDDGGQRFAEVVLAALLIRLLSLSADDETALEPFVRPPIKNWRNEMVGALRPTPILASH